MDVGAAAVEGFVGVEDEFLGEADGHAGGEDDPERLGLDDGVAESPRRRVDWVGVGGVGDDVVTAAFASLGVLSESDAAFR